MKPEAKLDKLEALSRSKGSVSFATKKILTHVRRLRARTQP